MARPMAEQGFKIAAFGAVLLLLAGCGDSALLEGLGDRSHEYVRGSTTIGLSDPNGDVSVTTTMPGTVPVESVQWFNEGIEGEIVGEGYLVVASVWDRGRDEGRFIQASPAEITEALPGVQFPAVTPQGSVWITSQLVYDAASATLDTDISAAFGMWGVEPYTEGEGRMAMLQVGQPASAGDDTEVTVISSGVEGGITLTWGDNVYRYELACGTEVPEDQCWQMVESMLPLETVAPGPSSAADEATEEEASQ